MLHVRSRLGPGTWSFTGQKTGKCELPGGFRSLTCSLRQPTETLRLVKVRHPLCLLRAQLAPKTRFHPSPSLSWAGRHVPPPLATRWTCRQAQPGCCMRPTLPHRHGQTPAHWPFTLGGCLGPLGPLPGGGRCCLSRLSGCCPAWSVRQRERVEERGRRGVGSEAGGPSCGAGREGSFLPESVQGALPPHGHREVTLLRPSACVWRGVIPTPASHARLGTREGADGSLRKDAAATAPAWASWGGKGAERRRRALTLG